MVGEDGNPEMFAEVGTKNALGFWDMMTVKLHFTYPASWRVILFSTITQTKKIGPDFVSIRDMISQK